ncbi:14462_t:CDS:2, partial [Gigaspora margarita]
IGYKKAINKEISEKEQYFFNIIKTEEDETKKINQNILLATKCGSRDYEIEELENQIENLKSGKVQNISNQPHALSQKLLNLDNHKQELILDKPRSKKATSSPSLSREEEFTREISSFNKNKIKEEYSRDLERYLKNRLSINLLLESNLEELCETVDTTKLDRIWDSFEKGILYAAKKNIPHKKLKKRAPNNLRPNKFDKNSTTASLSVDVVADFNHQVREINKKYGLEIMLKIENEKSKHIEDLVNQQCAIIKNEQGRMIQSLLEKTFCKVSIDRVLSNVNGEFLL